MPSDRSPTRPNGDTHYPAPGPSVPPPGSGYRVAPAPATTATTHFAEPFPQHHHDRRVTDHALHTYPAPIIQHPLPLYSQLEMPGTSHLTAGNHGQLSHPPPVFGFPYHGLISAPPHQLPNVADAYGAPFRPAPDHHMVGQEGQYQVPPLSTSEPSLVNLSVTSPCPTMPPLGQLPLPSVLLFPSHRDGDTVVQPHSVHVQATAVSSIDSARPCPEFDREKLPFPLQEDLTKGRLVCDGIPVIPKIHCRVDKGIVYKRNRNLYCSYRRNYFQVTSAFTLNPACHGSRVYFRGQAVQAFGCMVSAYTDNGHDSSHGSRIELFQFSAKRDHKTKRPMRIVKISPGLPLRAAATHSQLSQFSSARGQQSHAANYLPYLPYQFVQDPDPDPLALPSHRYVSDNPPLVDHGGNSSQKQHTFQRIQFKSATANNGKRRASQQYYHLCTELFVDVRSEGEPRPKWQKVAGVTSARIIVRGRSPRHYKDDDGPVEGDDGPVEGHDGDEDDEDDDDGDRTPTPKKGSSRAKRAKRERTGSSGKPGASVPRWQCDGGIDFGSTPTDSTLSPQELSGAAHVHTHYHEYGDDIKADLWPEPEIISIDDHNLAMHEAEDMFTAPRDAAPRKSGEGTFKAEHPAAYLRATVSQPWHYDGQPHTEYYDPTRDVSNGCYTHDMFDH